MTLHTIIKEDLKKAMLAEEEVRKVVLRGVLASFTNELLAKKTKATELTDDEAIISLRKLVKQRKDSIKQFTNGGRPELAKAEAKEQKILETYLPTQMSKVDIKKVVLTMKSELKITDKAGAGKLIGAVSKELKGKADGGDIKVIVDEVLK